MISFGTWFIFLLPLWSSILIAYLFYKNSKM